MTSDQIVIIVTDFPGEFVVTDFPIITNFPGEFVITDCPSEFSAIERTLLWMERDAEGSRAWSAPQGRRQMRAVRRLARNFLSGPGNAQEAQTKVTRGASGYLSRRGRGPPKEKTANNPRSCVRVDRVDREVPP
jgi:hypothetical protein